MALTDAERDAKYPAGWGWPGLARKAHYFATGDITSLCQKWMFTGERFDDNHGSSDNCAECKRRYQQAYGTPPVSS